MRSAMPAASARSVRDLAQPRVRDDPAAEQQARHAEVGAGGERLADEHVDDGLAEARRDVGDRHGSPRPARCSTQRATAVFRPEKQKSYRWRGRSLGCVSPRGKRIAVGSPPIAARSISGRPGTAARAGGRPCRTPRRPRRRWSRRAARRRRRGRARAAARCARRRRAGRWSAVSSGVASGVEQVGADVADEVVHGVERLAERDRERLGGADADHERAREARGRW